MRDIILIGGAAGTGKSTLARQLSAHLGVPWISTDQIRTVLKITERDEAKQIEMVWEGVSALAKQPSPWEGGIIEGIAITPHLVARDIEKQTNIKVIFLTQSSLKKIAEVIYERSKLPWIKTKTPEQQESKVRDISLFNTKIVEGAQEYGYPTVEGNSDATFKDMLRALKIAP